LRRRALSLVAALAVIGVLGAVAGGARALTLVSTPPSASPKPASSASQLRRMRDSLDALPPRQPPKSALTAGTVQIYVAMALQSYFLEVANYYELMRPGVHVVSSFAGAAELRAHIESDAIVDVLVSDDTTHIAALVRGGLCDSVRIVAHDRLVVIGRKDGPVKVLADLAMPGVRIASCVAEDPAGRSTALLLERWEKDKKLGKNFVKRVRSNLVGRDANTRESAKKVALADADAAFAYVTDLEMSKKKLVAVPTPDSLSLVTVIGAARVMKGRMPEIAADYLRFLSEPKVRAGFQKHGFLP
jgi:molybdate transport system substrate-binding protein